MTLRTALGLAPRIQGTRVGRSWRQRIEDLDAYGIDYAGETVLDAGCNVGILAYEISKRGPAFIHALDVLINGEQLNDVVSGPQHLS